MPIQRSPLPIEKPLTRSQVKKMSTDENVSESGEDESQNIRDMISEIRERVHTIEQQARKSIEDTANSSGINRDDLLLNMMSDISNRLEKVEKRCNQNLIVPQLIYPTERTPDFSRPTGRERESNDPTGREREFGRPTDRERESEYRGIPVFEAARDEYRFGNLKLPRGGWLKDPFEEITYFGRTDKQNPIRFLRKFERIALYENISEADQLHYFGKCLRGSAASWFDVREPVNIREAKRAFREYFWSDEHQARFRETLYTGKYSRIETKLSMAEYALDISRQAKSLEPPLSDSEIIRCVKRHFGSQISREIRPSTVGNMEDFVKLLDEIESESNREKEEKTRKTTLITIPKDNTENRAFRIRLGENNADVRARQTYNTDRFANNRDFAQTSRNADVFSRLRALENNIRYNNGNNISSNNNSNFRSYDNKERVPSTVKITEVRNNDNNVANSGRFNANARSDFKTNRKVAFIDKDEEYDEAFQEEKDSVYDDNNIHVEENIDEEREILFSEGDTNMDKEVNILRLRDLIKDVDDVTREVLQRPYAIVKFANINVKCLIDTGAQISAITQRLYDKLVENKIAMSIIPIRKFTLVGAFSEKGEVIANKVQVDFKIQEQTCTYGLYIVKNLAYDMILGLDFLSERNITMRCTENKFSIEFGEKPRDIPNIKSVNAMSIETAQTKLEKLMNEHEQLFRDEIGRVNNYIHEIKVTSNAPFKKKTYPIPDINRIKVKIADTLSRDNVKNGFVNKQALTRSIAAINCPDDRVETSQWVDYIAREQQNDVELVQKCQDNPETYIIRDELIRVKFLNKGERIPVPDAARWNLLRRIHLYLLHFGTDKVIEFAKRFFVIGNLERVARDVVASCHECLATKYYTRPTRGLHYYDLPNRPYGAISLDIFGPLPQTARNNKYILVVMDQFSKLTKLFPMRNQSLEIIMETLRTRYFNRIPIPAEILTDNAGQFITNRWSEYAEEIGFSSRKTSPYNPQSNPVERVMRELGRIIRVYSHDRQTSWDRIIERVEITINSTVHRSTGFRPYELHPDLNEDELIIDPRLTPREVNVDAEENADHVIQQKIQRAARTLQVRAGQRKTQSDRRGEADRYTQGEKVWVKLHRRSDASRRLTRKIHLVYEGPYVILREIRRNAYLVGDEHENAIGTYNSRQLRPHRESQYNPHVARIDVLRVVKGFTEVPKSILREIEYPSCNAENTRSREIEIVDVETGDSSPEILHEYAVKTTLQNIAIDESMCDAKMRASSILSESDFEERAVPKSGRSKPVPITEKGLRHIKRIFNVIGEDTPLFSIYGKLENCPMRLIFDKRGDFDVITSAAVQRLEDSNVKVEYIDDPENIPAYLKQQRNVKIQAINCRVGVRDKYVNIQPMILHGKEPSVLMSRHAIEQLYKQMMKHSGFRYAKRTFMAKGEEKLHRWIREDAKSLANTCKPSTSGMASVESKESSPRKVNPTFSEEDTDVIVNSEDEMPRKTKRIPTKRMKRTRFLGEHLTTEEVNGLWSSDEEMSCDPPSKPNGKTTKSVSLLVHPSTQSEDEERQRVIHDDPKKPEKEKENETSVKLQKKHLPEDTIIEAGNADIIFLDDAENEKLKGEINLKKHCNNADLTLPADKGVKVASVKSVSTAKVAPPTEMTMSVKSRETNRGGPSLSQTPVLSKTFIVELSDSGIGRDKSSILASSDIAKDKGFRSVDTSERDKDRDTRTWKLIRRALREITAHREEIGISALCEMSSRNMSDNLSLSDFSLSNEQLCQEEDELITEINSRIESMAVRQRTIERIRTLREIREKLKDIPVIPAGSTDTEEKARTEKVMNSIYNMYKASNVGTICRDKDDILDEARNPLYTVNSVISVTNLQPSDKPFRPVLVQFLLQGDAVHRFVEVREPDRIVPVASGTIPEESVPSTSCEVHPETSTPMREARPRITGCVAGSFIDETTLADAIESLKTKPGDSQPTTEHPVQFAHNFTMEQLLGVCTTPLQTQITDVSISAASDSSHEETRSPKKPRKRGRPVESGGRSDTQHEGPKSKEPRRYSKSRQASLARGMQPEVADASGADDPADVQPSGDQKTSKVISRADDSSCVQPSGVQRESGGAS